MLPRLNFLTKGTTIPPQRLLAVVGLFSSSFAWFYVFFNYFDEFSPGSINSFWYNAGVVTLLTFVAVSAILGSAIAGKVDRRKLLFIWITSGVLAVIPIPFFQNKEFLPIWCALAGFSFGVGFPSCQAFFVESTASEERGKVGGLMILVTFVLVAFSFVLKPALSLDPSGIVLLLIGIKSIGFLSLIFDPFNRVQNEPKPWRNIVRYRDFNLYLLAYVLFNVAAGLVVLLWNSVPSNEAYDQVTRDGGILRLLGLCVSAIVAGFAADRIGRKKPIMFGLFMLGAAYALVGLLTTPDTYFVTLMLSGFAWGIIMVGYLVVPGDLAFPGSAERFYTVGWVLPLILYTAVEGTGRLTGYSPRIDLFSTILTIILFAAILPLWSAVETMSESKIRERRLREHAQRVSKLVQESQADEV